MIVNVGEVVLDAAIKRPVRSRESFDRRVLSLAQEEFPIMPDPRQTSMLGRLARQEQHTDLEMFVIRAAVHGKY